MSRFSGDPTVAWVPVLGIFDKLREVGFYPTCFTPCLSDLLMIQLI